MIGAIYTEIKRSDGFHIRVFQHRCILRGNGSSVIDGCKAGWISRFSVFLLPDTNTIFEVLSIPLGWIVCADVCFFGCRVPAMGFVLVAGRWSAYACAPRRLSLSVAFSPSVEQYY